MAELPKRPRLQFDCPERFRLAIRLRAVRSRLDPSQVILAALSAFMPDELIEADNILASEPPPPPSPRGRKRKPRE